MAHRCPLLWIVVAAPLLSHIQLFVTPWTAAHQAPRFSTISQSLLKFMPIESVMPSSHLILCRSLLLLPSIFPTEPPNPEGGGKMEEEPKAETD